MGQTLTWTYAAGLSLSFVTDDAVLDVQRIIYEDVTVGGTIVITDTDKYQRVLSFTTTMTSANAKTLHDLLVGGTIDYTSAYPTITFTWSTGVTSTWEVWEPKVVFSDQANNYRKVSFVMKEKS